MEAPPRIRFEAINGLSENEVKTSEFVVYAHKCSKGIYVGMAGDPLIPSSDLAEGDLGHTAKFLRPLGERCAE